MAESLLFKSKKSKKKPNCKDVPPKKFENEVLLTVTSAKPLDFTPDRLIIEFNRIVFIKHEMFRNETIDSFFIEDIVDVILNTSFFFASLTLFDKFLKQSRVIVNYLSRPDALKARNLIVGILMVKVEKYPKPKAKTKEEFVNKLIKLGETRYLPKK